MGVYENVVRVAINSKEAKKKTAIYGTEKKNNALLKIAQYIIDRRNEIIDANKVDMDNAAKEGISQAFLDRLMLNEKRIEDIAEGVRQTAALSDPVGEVIRMWRRPNGLEIGQRRVPIGVIGIIYEARPNVTVDAAALCLKSGNTVILKGGKEALQSNKALVKIMRDALKDSDFQEDAVQLIEDTSRDAVDVLIKLKDYLDLVIPRGGRKLIDKIVSEATVPAIQTGAGNCHIFVDKDCDTSMAENIILNAKTQRPAVCNAMEKLLVHKDIADKFIPDICEKLRDKGVELRGCQRTRAIVPGVIEATTEDWYEEYDDMILAIKVVDSIDDAIEHIAKYSTGHSEAIITNDYNASRKFLDQVDSAAVYVNASTRFTDGFEFGFGGEIGISTQKLHARGPMGLNELTTTKYIIYGNGQIRK